MARKNFGAKPLSYPQPVLIIAAYGKDDVPSAMNAAWGGIFNTNQICICLDKSHKTVANIKETKAFTVSVADVDHLVQCDYVGIVSANKVPDKLTKAGLKVSKSRFVNAPVPDDLKMVLECELVSYDEKTEQLVGNIINVAADESVLTEGKIDPAKLKPITYDPVNHTYLQIGKIAGKAFEAGKALTR